jgi:CRISPR-associated endonuclease/helicase Cas3
MLPDYSIILKPIYSSPATEVPPGVQLPPGWALSWHQAATLAAIRDPHIDVIFNTAMTGDGKSLAAYLDSLQKYSPVLGLYPTNELARDQETQIKKYLAAFQPEHDPRVNRLSGQELEIYAESEGLRKGDAFETKASNSEILLANPDIFHYLHRGAYLISKDNPDKLWGRIDKRFKLIIFDEFHVFQAPQIASTINTMLLIRNTNRNKKFLFLSATPNQQLIERLQAAKFNCCWIDPLGQEKYQFPETGAEGEELKNCGWRQISQEITLNFVALQSNPQASESWLKEQSESILAYFEKYPGSKGAIILNSIAAVKRLTKFFQELPKPESLRNFKIGENTGLSGRQTKAEAFDADLIFGTSTIDVGVDFQINFLIFESADAGNFIQRLGRLGRHRGYERNGQKVIFNNFTAWALVPKFLASRLFGEENPPLQSGGIYDRSFLNAQIGEKYRKINNFDSYYSRWGAVQSMHLVRQLGHPNIKAVYGGGSQEALKNDCETVFGTAQKPISLKAVFGCSKRWEKEWRERSGKKQGNPILEEAIAFRGSSPLQCGIYDEKEPNEADRFKTYDLPGILSNLEIEPMTAAAFERLRKATAERTETTIPKGRFEHCLGFFKLLNYRQERLDWKFTYPGNLEPFAEAWKVQVLWGMRVWQPDNYWITKINQQLEKQALVCYVLPCRLAEVRGKLRLPMHFQIYSISDQSSIHDPSPPYSIAFGLSALLVDTQAGWLKSQGGEIWIASSTNP